MNETSDAVVERPEVPRLVFGSLLNPKVDVSVTSSSAQVVTDVASKQLVCSIGLVKLPKPVSWHRGTDCGPCIATFADPLGNWNIDHITDQHARS